MDESDQPSSQETEPEIEELPPLTFLQMLGSTFSAAFGVQSPAQPRARLQPRQSGALYPDGDRFYCRLRDNYRAGRKTGFSSADLT